jgi:chorismate lyase/3-hydroxybenzoate synthase
LDLGAAGLLPPAWVCDLIGDSASPRPLNVDGRFSAHLTQSRAFSLVTVRVPEAVALDAAEFQQRTAEAYQLINRTLADSPTPNPVRLWNHVPEIGRPLGDGTDRYMVFNAGRFAAFSNWYGSPDAFDRRLATATGVGHHGTDLVIHCLASDRPGDAVANPRQIAPYRYSRRYGPQPPCFARATVIRPAPDRPPLILVGGTASVRGEDSKHAGDVQRQTLETFQNLLTLLHAAAGGMLREQPSPPPGLHQFRHLRAYYVNQNDARTIANLILDSFSSLQHLELVHADVCRPELLVEIEGIAVA